MNLKSFVLFIITFFISFNCYSYESFICNIVRTQPALDLSKIKFPETTLRINFKKKEIYPFNNYKLYDIEFSGNIVTWLHTAINPINNKEKIYFNKFNKSTRRHLVSIYPNKNNLKKSDLIMSTYSNCSNL